MRSISVSGKGPINLGGEYRAFSTRISNHQGGLSVKKTWLSMAFVALFILAFASLALAADYISVPYVRRGPKIDGKLDDEAWTIAEQKGGKALLEYNLNGRPASSSYKVEVFVCWDDDNLYVAYKNYQKKNTVIAEHYNDGDASWLTDDDNQTFIAPSYPAFSHMQTISNPNAIRTTFGMGTNNSWEVEAAIYNDYWVVEKAIPFDNFNEWPEVGDEWSGNFTRHIGANSGAGDTEWLSLSSLVRDFFAEYDTFVILEFIK